jgi:AhpD family alkylhydroperoxidase
MVIGGLVAGEVAVAQRAADKPMPSTASSTMAMPMTPKAVMDDIQSTIGFVPQFFRAVSDTQLPSFWAAMKTFQMNPNTALDARTKELIGLAVASQIPCDYCVEFHTAVARHAGASDQQIKEAIGMASMTRMASTVINGNQVDKAQFKKDVQRLVSSEQKKPATSARR